MRKAKRAKYFCVDNAACRFCSKCALAYAMIGKKVLEIDEDQLQPNYISAAHNQKPAANLNCSNNHSSSANSVNSSFGSTAKH